jgi:glutamyl-tRNA synthetase
MICDNNNQIISHGKYGPYQQSQRIYIYQSWVSYLLETDQAYVCFLTPQELETMRVSQQLSKQPTGVYGSYALSRNLTQSEIIARIEQGDQWVIRRKAKQKV